LGETKNMNKYHKVRIKTFIASGRTGRAVNLLLEYWSSDKDISNEIISISSRYRNYLREKHGNLVDTQTLTIELNKINNSILHILEDEIELKIIFFNRYIKIALASAVVCLSIFLGYQRLINVNDLETQKSEQKDTLELEIKPAQPLFDSAYLLPPQNKVKMNLTYYPKEVNINKSPKTNLNQFLKIIHTNNEYNKGFPIYYYTLKNYMNRSIVINKFSIIVRSQILKKYFGGPKELEPLAIWDIPLPRAKGEFAYKPFKPIEIPSNDACVIGIRFACLSSEDNKYLPPQKVAEFELVVNFFDDFGNKAESEIFKIR